MSSWIGRGILIAAGASWLLVFGGLALYAARRTAEQDIRAAAWLVASRGIPGALFIAAGLSGSQNVLWAAAGVLVTTLIIGAVISRNWRPDD